jgi:Ras-related protein Rab-6A
VGPSTALPDVAPLCKHKICFLGDQGAGKTSIIRSFVKGSFTADYKVRMRRKEVACVPSGVVSQATIGVDFLSKTLYMDDKTVRLQVWDTAGQERFRSLAPSYIRDSEVAVIVFDVTSRASFDSVSHWVGDVKAVQGPEAKFVIVGNKSDLSSERDVSIEEAGAMSKEMGGMFFIETSAKQGHNVKTLFHQLARALPSTEALASTAGGDSNRE